MLAVYRIGTPSIAIASNRDIGILSQLDLYQRFFEIVLKLRYNCSAFIFPLSEKGIPAPRPVFNMLGAAVKTKTLPLINFRDTPPSLCLPPYVTFAHRYTRFHCLVVRAAAHCKHKPYCNYGVLLNTELLPGGEKLPSPGSSKTSLTPFLRVSFSVTATRRSCCCCCCQSERK